MLAEKNIEGRISVMEKQRKDKMTEMQRIILEHLSKAPYNECVNRYRIRLVTGSQKGEG